MAAVDELPAYRRCLHVTHEYRTSALEGAAYQGVVLAGKWGDRRIILTPNRLEGIFVPIGHRSLVLTHLATVRYEQDVLLQLDSSVSRQFSILDSVDILWPSLVQLYAIPVRVKGDNVFGLEWVVFLA